MADYYPHRIAKDIVRIRDFTPFSFRVEKEGACGTSSKKPYRSSFGLGCRSLAMSDGRMTRRGVHSSASPVSRTSFAGGRFFSLIIVALHSEG